jgi:tetratricopeptide (TPR) repeat protein
VFKTLLFLLLQTDRYSEAIEVFTRFPELSAQSDAGVQFEKAYCLYRLHRGEEALGSLDDSRENAEQYGGLDQEEQRRVEHLRGQIVSYTFRRFWSVLRTPKAHRSSRPCPHAPSSALQLYRAGKYEQAEEVYGRLLDNCPVVSSYRPCI